MTTENLTINEALKNLIPSDQSIIENDIMDAEIRLKKTKKSIPLEKLVAKIKMVLQKGVFKVGSHHIKNSIDYI